MRNFIAITLVGLCGLILSGVKPASAQTGTPCPVLIVNYSRERISISEIALLKADDTKQYYSQAVVLEPGERVYLKGKGEEFLEGRQIWYTVKAPDGARVSYHSTTKTPFLGERDYILQEIDDKDLAKTRESDNSRLLTRDQRTYRYWNAVHGIVAEERIKMATGLKKESSRFTWEWNPIKAINKPGDMILKHATNCLRNVANRVDDLDTKEVDDDAVAVAAAFTAFNREAIKRTNDLNGLGTTILVELVRKKADWYDKAEGIKKENVSQSEDMIQLVRSKKKKIESRYGIGPVRNLVSASRNG